MLEQAGAVEQSVRGQRSQEAQDGSLQCRVGVMAAELQPPRAASLADAISSAETFS